MILQMYIKEVKQFFRKSFNVIFMLLAPIILILLMGYAMSNLIGTSEAREDQGNTLLYIIEHNANSEHKKKFLEFGKYIEESMRVEFKEVEDYKKGYKEVNMHQAIALIRVSSEGFYYYRSPYNEPTMSKMIRTAYHSLLNANEDFIQKSFIEVKEIKQKTINSYTYFTFAELGFIMMYLSLIVGQSVYSEKEIKTFERIYMSKANTGKMLFSKVALGCTVGIIQIILVYLLSSQILKVKWGSFFFFILLLYALFAVFSSTIGAVLGLYVKNKTSLNDKILTLCIFFGFLGGGLTPISFLTSVKVMSILCKVSPLYWITNAAINLSRGIINKEYFISIILCLISIAFLIIIYGIKKSKEVKKGVFNYE